ncbi:uncharacterized protein HKW66_Vig0227040 [Vigna angularis]|uniref:Uncharacterized protein n=1 Tax=Phaseolus angularis TaxID=3914 RepID=A0A8T0KAZ6_PHAAN|nr:uncharacterized protein HKW66_Vig0227040 [Vigna angularis]
MEEYLQYMKTLRSQMNGTCESEFIQCYFIHLFILIELKMETEIELDVEDEAAKISVEEEMQLTNVRTLESDIESAKSGITQLKEDTEKMRAAKGEICSKILEKQKRIASLEFDTIKLSQTLELIQQERVGLSSKLSEKRAYYSKVAEDMNAKLQKQQVDFHYYYSLLFLGDLWRGSVARTNLINELDSAKARLEEILTLKAKVLTENTKIKLAIEDVKCRENEFKPELKAAGLTALEEEYKALLLDKAGETEYLQSLENQVEKLKEIRHVVKCACGEEYNVALNK